MRSGPLAWEQLSPMQLRCNLQFLTDVIPDAVVMYPVFALVGLVHDDRTTFKRNPDLLYLPVVFIPEHIKLFTM